MEIGIFKCHDDGGDIGVGFGPELVVNGNFSLWTGDNPDGWVVSGEVGVDPMITEDVAGCRLYTSGALISLDQNILNIVDTFEVTFNIVTRTVGTLVLVFGSVNVGVYTTSGWKRFRGKSNGSFFKVKRGGGLNDFVFSNVSVKKVFEMGGSSVGDPVELL